MVIICGWFILSTVNEVKVQQCLSPCQRVEWYMCSSEGRFDCHVALYTGCIVLYVHEGLFAGFLGQDEGLSGKVKNNYESLVYVTGKSSAKCQGGCPSVYEPMSGMPLHFEKTETCGGAGTATCCCLMSGNSLAGR